MDPADNSIPKMLVLIGVVLILIGLIWWLAPGKLHWLGRLPGDIRIERENFRFYFPITTMVLFSLLLYAVQWIIQVLRR